MNFLKNSFLISLFLLQTSYFFTSSKDTNKSILLDQELEAAKKKLKKAIEFKNSKFEYFLRIQAENFLKEEYGSSDKPGYKPRLDDVCLNPYFRQEIRSVYEEIFEEKIGSALRKKINLLEFTKKSVNSTKNSQIKNLNKKQNTITPGIAVSKLNQENHNKKQAEEARKLFQLAAIENFYLVTEKTDGN